MSLCSKLKKFTETLGAAALRAAAPNVSGLFSSFETKNANSPTNQFHGKFRFQFIWPALQEGPKVQNASNPKSQHFLRIRSEPKCVAAWVGSGGQAAAHFGELPIGLNATRQGKKRIPKRS